MMWFIFLLIIHCVYSTTIQLNKIFNYECETNLNCTNLILNSICFNKKCICQFGYTSNGCIVEKNPIRYRREINYGMRMLGEECNWSNQCRRTPVDGTKVCLSYKCQCSHGYIPIDSYRCIQDFELIVPNKRVTKSYENEPSGYGSACLTDNDCHDTDIHLECYHGICVCLDGYVPLGKYICYNIHAQEGSTMAPLVSSTIRQDYPINNEVIKSLGKIGNTCMNDYFCRRTVSESHCYNGKCTCIDGYISIDQYTCMKNMNEYTTTKSTLIPVDYKNLLGGNCLTKRNCHTSNAICLNSICSCPKGYFPVDDWTCLEESETSNEELIETTLEITKSSLPPPPPPPPTTTTFSTTTIFRWWPWSPTTRQTFDLKNTFRVRCLLNRQCASMDKNSHCTLFGRCICNRGYQLETINNEQRCIPRIINENDCD